MGTWLRNLSNRRLWLRYREDIREIEVEYGINLAWAVFKPLCNGSIPDPWDDYRRQDIYDRCWKRHRINQWRIKTAHQKTPRPKVTYDTDWTYIGGRLYPSFLDEQYSDINMSNYKAVQSILRKKRWLGQVVPFRVRFAYRKHKYEKTDQT